MLECYNCLMSNVATRDDINEVLGVLREFMTRVDNRFNGMESRISALETQFDGIEERVSIMDYKFQSFASQVQDRFQALEEKIDQLYITIDGFIGRIDIYEAESAARDIQFKHLTAWAFKVSKKTNTPLNNT